MSLSDYLNSIPPELRKEALAEFEALPESNARLDDLFEQAAYERSVALDPSGQRISRVLLRLEGDATANAGLDDASAADLVGAFGREVRAAAGDNSDDAQLRLVGFSAGSVILHYEPVRPELEQAEDGAFAVHSAADNAIATVLELHKAIEAGFPPNEIKIRFKPLLLEAARAFIKKLDNDSLDLSARWYGPSGTVSTAAVTSVGRRYALDTLFDAAKEHEPERISGLVSGLDLDGFVTITVAPNRKPKVKVPEDLITNGSFPIGGYVQIRAMKNFEKDRVGISSKPTYEFVEFAFDDGAPPTDN